MKITIAHSTGFCSGVQRAIKGAKRALENHVGIHCLGEIIHNPRVIESLKKQGLVVVDDIESVPEGAGFIIRSHGLPKNLIEKAALKGLEVLDFTCPKVKKIHTLVTRLSEDGYFILVAGNPNHPEVKAILSLVERKTRSAGDAIVVQRPEDLSIPDRCEKVALVVQTVATSRTTLVHNTLCEETLKRQREALELAERVDCMVVVGGKNSSNTRTLFDLVRRKVPAVHIEGCDELDERLFRGVERVGIISGASTPEEEVREVYRKLENFSGHR
jgi:(E)-4-hydroxy-3-methyl-but-2-enyl pyrophosphate reductase